MPNKNYPKWFYKRGNYITSVCDFTKKDLIRNAELTFNKPWKELYRHGGRAVKVMIREVK